jgi:valyl-tRNA synthetase
VLEKLLRLMHPFMPFVTEELWQTLPWAKDQPHRQTGVKTIMLQPYPKTERDFVSADAENTVAALKAIVEAVRNFRGENNIAPRVPFALKYIFATRSDDVFVKTFKADIQALTHVQSIEGVSRAEAGQGGELEAVIPIANPPIELRIALKGLVNVDEETKRLRKEIDKVKSDLEFVRNKLGKETFIAKAPPELVAKEKVREAEFVSQLKELEAAINRMSKLTP